MRPFDSQPLSGISTVLQLDMHLLVVIDNHDCGQVLLPVPMCAPDWQESLLIL